MIGNQNPAVTTMFVSGYPKTNPIFKLDAHSLENKRDLTDHRSISSQSMSPIPPNHMTSPKIKSREVETRDINYKGRIGLFEIQDVSSISIARHIPHKIELSPTVLSQIKSPKDYDYKNANEVLESLKTLISALQKNQASF